MSCRNYAVDGSDYCRMHQRIVRVGFRSKKCKDYLQKKIRKNIGEYKKGRYKSPKQAIAVSYSQTRKKKGCGGKVGFGMKSVCWKGYERVPGTKKYSKGSCRKKSRR